MSDPSQELKPPSTGMLPERSSADETDDRIPLRADLLTSVVTAPPGETVAVVVQVLNTSHAIEKVTVELVGLIPETVTIQPSSLTLFPGESAEVKLALTFHRTLPAGEHDGLILVSGSSPHVAPTMVAFTVRVPSSPAFLFDVEPPVIVGKKRAIYDLRLVNDGNVELTTQVRAVDENRLLNVMVSRPTVELGVEASADLEIQVRGRRPWTGSPVEHVIQVEVAADQDPQQLEVRFRQKPRFSAGIITVFTLVVIVLLWAAAMYFGVGQALKGAEPVKAVPANFQKGLKVEELDPTKVGGDVQGRVVAASNGKGIAGITVEARNSDGQAVASTSTNEDGGYELTGLLPILHTFRLAGPGYVSTVVNEPAASAPLRVVPNPATPIAPADFTITGRRMTLGGQVVTADGPATGASVEVSGLDLLAGEALPSPTVDASGNWSLAGLQAPGLYQVRYVAGGYTPVVSVHQLDPIDPIAAAGAIDPAAAEAETRFELPVTRLPAAAGSISGVVVDLAGKPLGGVDIVAARDGEAFTFTTPTSGLVGEFKLETLPTPATYLVTFSAEGFATETQAIRLGPGVAVTDLAVTLSPATGSVAGLVTSASGEPLGGVHIAVTIGGQTFETDSLTGDGEVGRYRLDALPLPGKYAVTFSVEGFLSETVAVELGVEQAMATRNVTMHPALGQLSGIVVDQQSREARTAVAIEVSDGAVMHKTTSASLPDSERGRFRLVDLPPGSYTVTARSENGDTVTVIIEIRAGDVTEVTLELGEPT